MKEKSQQENFINDKINDTRHVKLFWQGSWWHNIETF